jgi:UDP-N-acetyl-D-glucosamine dehydrogenase
MGMGYVGLPLAVSFTKAGFHTVGLEVDDRRRSLLAHGHSYIDDLSDEDLAVTRDPNRFVVDAPTKERIAVADVVVICLPTPLDKAHDPDLRILSEAFSTIRSALRRGQLIILTSTTYPGTTEELALPILQTDGLTAGVDFFLAFSPERVDPGNRQYAYEDVPRVVAGITAACGALCQRLFETVTNKVLLVSNCRTAEMTKLLENTFRSVNIGLVNEMAMICRKLGVDIWEVVDAAATKPYGFMPFFPGPGLGGHCIPIDPAYLAWRLRMLNYRARFVELAEDVNNAMPEYAAGLVSSALNDRGKTLRGSRILALGLAYKKDVADARESPATEVIKILAARGAKVQAHDPLVANSGLEGVEILREAPSREQLRQQECVIILTDHSAYDWPLIFRHARLVIDTRGVSRRLGISGDRVVRL